MLEPNRQTKLSNLYVHEYPPGKDGFHEAMVEGLSADSKSIPFKFLYDERGSGLFEQICQQPEYYPTRTELKILQSSAGEIAGLAGRHASLVELGSGAGQKIQLLLDALDQPESYTAIDISREAVLPAGERIASANPSLDVHAIWADFGGEFTLPANSEGGRTIGFFPGSSIGNFTRTEARAFLQHWRKRLGPESDMLIGVDLVKSVPLLEAAYDDAAGVTAAFSLNVLRRANYELGADFQLKNFRHQARYDANLAAIVISLISTRDQIVTIGGQRFQFAALEPVHIESSYKYDVGGFADLAEAAGYRSVAAWTDDEKLFSVHYLRASD